MEKWILKNASVDVAPMAKYFNINEPICRIMINRNIRDRDSIGKYLNAKRDQMYSPNLMKDMDKAVKMLCDKIKLKKRIRICGDYDIDGIMSTYILYKGLSNCGAEVDYIIPHRIHDGYGINEEIVRNAAAEGVDTILTCDNGIAALGPIETAKSLGLTCIVTDHHDIAFIEGADGQRIYTLPAADAVIDCKQQDCLYPYKELCGAGVAYKLIQEVYQQIGYTGNVLAFLEYAGIATVCDVVDLLDENRIIVKEALHLINQTRNVGLRALINETGLDGKQISTYHLGFVLGPCFNASGRLDHAKKGIELLLEEDPFRAKDLAKELNALNVERKAMTQQGLKDIITIIEETGLHKDKVILAVKEDIHESLAGIIAGRLRERYHRPSLVLTKAIEGMKGSGRSIEAYNMFEELLKCKPLLTKFGGHPMAAGLSLEEANVLALRHQLNEKASLTEEDLIPKIMIDVHFPIHLVTMSFIEELEILEPFGKANSKPVFADRSLHIKNVKILGQNKNVLKCTLYNGHGSQEAIYFGDVGLFQEKVSANYGLLTSEKLMAGLESEVMLDIIYYPDINEYLGNKSIQIVISNFKCI